MARSARCSSRARPGGERPAQWLSTPAGHARDVRSELMIKLALPDRAGADPQPLLSLQMKLAVIAAAPRRPSARRRDC